MSASDSGSDSDFYYGPTPPLTRAHAYALGRPEENKYYKKAHELILKLFREGKIDDAAYISGMSQINELYVSSEANQAEKWILLFENNFEMLEAGAARNHFIDESGPTYSPRTAAIIARSALLPEDDGPEYQGPGSAHFDDDDFPGMS